MDQGLLQPMAKFDRRMVTIDAVLLFLQHLLEIPIHGLT
jgi:hypothetical protein